jgi:gluconate kinase
VGIRNYLIEGVSGTGKTSVCTELARRGFHAVHGDRDLAYQGDPETGEPTAAGGHEHHLWRVDALEALVANRDEDVTFFCGGSRNFSKFLHLFDGVFVLEVDLETLNRRLDARTDSEWGGGRGVDRALIERLHRTKEDVPANGIPIDATAPLADVVAEILRIAEATPPV